MKCDVCKKRFPIDKCNVYRVTEAQSISQVFTTPSKVFNAVDCPTCGCQHLLKVRLPEMKGGAEDDD